MGLIRCIKVQVLFVDMSTEMKMGFIAEENEVEDSRVVFNSFRDALAESNLSLLFASVCCWRICILLGNNVKSLSMTLCTDVLEIPTSCDSRLVDFRGDCCKWSLTA